MSVLREVAILLALSLLGAAGTHLLHPRAPAWHEVEEPLRDDEVTWDLIRERWGGEVLWIDARPRAQFERGHIPGAINISEQELEAQLFDNLLLLQDTRKPVVIYCDTGACQASRKLRAYLVERLPILEFHVLRGGWSAWQRDNPAR